MIRTLWVALNLIVATVPLSLVVIVAGLLRIRGSVYEKLGRFWSQWVLWASGTRVRIEGAEHVHSDAPKIIVSNHQSWYDVFALAAYIPGRYRFVAKQELARIPLWGRAWRAAGHISVDRSDRQAAIRSLDRAGRVIREDNSSIVIFPEGTRSPTGELLPFKKGAFMLAMHTQADIVPTGVTGGRHVLAKGDWRVRKGEIVIRFGEPIPPGGYDEGNRDDLIARIRAEMQRLVDTPAQRIAPGARDAGPTADPAPRRETSDARAHDAQPVEDRSTAET